MIIGLTNLSFGNQNFKTLVRHTKNLGFKYLEVAPFILSKQPFSEKNIKIYNKILNEEKFKIISLQSTFFPYKKKLNKKNLISHFSKLFKFAKKLNIKNISIGTTPYRKDNSKDLKEINFNFFKNILFFAKKYNISVSVEPISKKYNNKFLITHNEVLSFIDNVKNTKLKMLFDFGNFYENSYKDNIKTFFKKNIKKINHVHLSNKNIKKFDKKYIQKNLILLKKLRYKKTVTIEILDRSGKKILNLKKNNVWNTW